jgi:hypothetical protein
LFLSWARAVQSTPPHPISSRSISVSSNHLSRRLPSGPFPYGFLTNNLYAFLFSLIPATCPNHLILLGLIILIILGKEYKSQSFSLFGFLHPPVTSSLFSQNVLLNTLFSNTLSPCMISGFHGADYEEFRLLECDTVGLL